MCDYSLYEFHSRLAAEGETLVVHKFPSGSVGLIAKAQASKPPEHYSALCAVCIPPGARLRIRTSWFLFWQDVTFIQTSLDVNRHRDAFRFADGHYLSLQVIPLGTELMVLSLVLAEVPAETKPEPAILAR